MSERLSRRHLIKVAGVAGAAGLTGPALAQPAERQTPGMGEPPVAARPGLPPEIGAELHHQPAAPLYFFFTEPEAAFVRAAADRLIPPDEQWPGAGDAGVVEYIDRQLAGAYGNGAGIYLDGPWQQGTPEQGYQLRYTPAELYRVAIAAINRHLADELDGRGLPDLEPEEQDQALERMESGEIQIEELPVQVFFETLLANTIEGFFADPAYGGNRDMVGWRMVGFPGAYGQYAFEVEQHGMIWDHPPVSMADTVHSRHHGHD